MYAGTTPQRADGSAAKERRPRTPRAAIVTAGVAIALTCALCIPATALATDAWEPDDARVAVPAIPADGTVFTRALDTEGDVDWIALQVTAGHTYVIEGLPTAAGDWFDIKMDVFASTSPICFASDDDGGTNLMPKLVLTAASSGTWNVRVAGFSYWSTGAYSIRAREVVPARVGGTVTGLADITMPGVTVTAYAADTTGWDATAKTTSDSSGRYTVTLEPGTYRLAYSVAGGTYPTRYWRDAEALIEAESIGLEPDQTLDTGRVSVIEWTRVTGRLTGWDGSTPLTGISVAAYRCTGTEWKAFSWTVTDSTGTWIMPIASGTYRFGYTDSTGRALPRFHPEADTVLGAQDITVDGAPVTLAATLASPARVEGTVTDSLEGSPIGDVQVSLVAPTADGWITVAQTTTLDDGSFSIDHRTGTFALWFCSADGAYCASYQDGCSCGDHVTTLELGANGLTVDVELQPAAGLSGRITDPATGAGVPNAVIDAYRLDAETGEWVSALQVATGSTGSYSLGGLTAGTYRVSATITDSPATTRFYGDARAIESATDIFAVAGQMNTGLDIEVSADTEPPVTNADTDRILLAPATVRLQVADETAVARTLYRLDGAEWVEGRSVLIETRGEHTIEYYSVDVAGNAEEPTVETLFVREATVTMNTLAGADRYETAIRISRESFPGGAETLIVVTGSSWPDGLGAASLAGVLDSPILLVKTDSVPAAVAAEARRLLPARVVIVGGESAASAQVAAHFRELVGSNNVRRIGGGDRYETARLVAEASLAALRDKGREWDGSYILASGLSFPDVLAASPLSAAQGWPVLLTKPDALSAATASFIDGHAGARALVVGGPAAVSTTAEADAAARSGATGDRLSGKDRYETALGIAAYAADSGLLGYQHLAIATGQDFPDALTCSVRQAKAGSVLLLTPRASLDADVAAMLESLPKSECTEVTFVGGAAAISEVVRAQVVAHLAR